MGCKGGIKESSAQWERWCLGMCIGITCEANAICLIFHRSTPQKRAHRLWVFGLCLWEICSWFRGFAVWSSQPTTSCKADSEHVEGPLQRSVGPRFKSSFQDKNRGKKTLQVSIPGHLYNQNIDQLCVWPQALNSSNKLYESLKP